MPQLTRRLVLSGALCALGGCNAISSLNAATEPLNTYDLSPAAGSTSGRRTSRTLLIARPQASAVLATDRIMIKPDAQSVTYLPDARWGDELPAVVQTLLIRSIAETGRVGYVGSVDAGPVPDKALLVRIDAFDVRAVADGTYTVAIDMDLSVINDRTQSIVASRRFREAATIADDDIATIISAFQTLLNSLLPSISDWAVQRV